MPPMLHNESWQQKPSPQKPQMACKAVPKHTCKTIGDCSWALSWDGYRAWVCEAVQTIAREQTSIWGRNCGQPSTRPPFFRQASALCCTWAWSPLYICMTGRPMPRQSGHLQESSFPLWRPGLVMPRPCHTNCSFRPGEKLRKKQKS